MAQESVRPVRSFVPDWAADIVWYQIFPERFRNGSTANDPTPDTLERPAPAGWRIRPWGSDWYALDDWERQYKRGFFESVFDRRYGGDLLGVREKIDYLVDLGIRGVYFNPLFWAASLHKYDGWTYHHIDPHFGPDPVGDKALLAHALETEDPATWIWTAADRYFLELVDALHARGIRVLLDGVFNHTGRGCFAFQDIVRCGKASRYVDWYRITGWDARAPDGFRYLGWFGVRSLPEFARSEHDLHPGPKQYVFDAVRRWLAPEGDTAAGIDGWRLDVAFCLPHGFWKDFRRHVKAINPQAYLVAETWTLDPSWVQGDEFDATMNYPFGYAASEFLVNRPPIAASVLDRQLAADRAAYPACVLPVLQNYIDSHDTLRLATFIRNPEGRFRDLDTFQHRTRVVHNRALRIDKPTPDEYRRQRLVALLAMTYIGAPTIYYGDEVGMWGANDPCCRKPMLWDDIDYENEQADPYGRPRKTDPVRPDHALRTYYQRLIAIRNAHPALRRGSFETLLVDDTARVFAFRRATRGNRIVVVLNAGEEEVLAELHGLRGTWHDALTDQRFAARRGTLCVPVERVAGRILVQVPRTAH